MHRRVAEDEDAGSGDSSGDEFYDRTAGQPGAPSTGLTAAAKRQKRDDEPVAEADDAASLFGKKVGLTLSQALLTCPPHGSLCLADSVHVMVVHGTDEGDPFG